MIKYNEKLYAERLLTEGFLTKYIAYELKILVKYFKQEKKISAKERKILLYEFCEKYISEFNRVKYFKIINSALRYGSKGINKLIVINSIPITDKEIEYINELEIEEHYKKVLFTLLVKIKLNKELCLQKFNNASKFNFFGGKVELYKEIKQMSKIPDIYDINIIINELSTMGYIDIRNRGRVNLLFIESIEVSKEIVFEITNFYNIGYYFDWFNGANGVIKCENEGCEEIVKKTNNNMKYCVNCAKEVKLEQNKLWKREYDKSRKIENPYNPTPTRV